MKITKEDVLNIHKWKAAHAFAGNFIEEHREELLRKAEAEHADKIDDRAYVTLKFHPDGILLTYEEWSHGVGSTPADPVEILFKWSEFEGGENV